MAFLAIHSIYSLILVPAIYFTAWISEDLKEGRGENLMPLPLPSIFGENEWFVIITTLIFYLLVFLLPKRLPLSVMIVIMLLGSVIARLYDHLLSPPYLNLYHVMNSGKYELFDIIVYALYAPFSYFFIYLYDKFNIHGYWTLVYIVGFSLAGTLFEGMAVYFHVFNYINWKLQYSFSVYLFVQSLTLFIYHLIIRHHHIVIKKVS
ncbi:hypothetical protein KHA96_08815 [Bacillus sp. FJAT-49711]|uniref:hypothetical protein n=1 Tax=Bacillus sp. FJAT-49711 TaxID=2833585 RepID=UPI001BC9399A|nr:hypothetical protein [Bacillus sp. FJAT-49711]MBS4218410.1 hypothetical protein [Bacillus sp. FJAT-49711]